MMTRGLLSHLTATLLALHAVLGCCWHHAHACEPECNSTPTVEAPCDCADDCGTKGCDARRHNGRHDCQESPCVFLNSTKWDSRAALLRLDLPPAACLSCGGSSHVVVDLLGPLFAADALQPPLRLHLVHQVLLL